MKKADVIGVLVSAAVTAAMLGGMTMGLIAPRTSSGETSGPAGILDKFDMAMTNVVSEALDGVLAVDRVYWLRDQDPVAPEPDPEGYGSMDDPAELGWLLEEARDLLDGETLLFTTETAMKPGSEITYYLDETILVITWKQVVDQAVYTFSEVKIAHPSQFRRFLAGGEYGSGVLYTTTELAASVNAVTASSGDYYSYRPFGLCVYDGKLQRFGGKELDTCFVDANSDLHLVYRGELGSREEAERYVEENDIRFSLAFGPILVKDGQVDMRGGYYPLGEVEKRYSRAALCQQGQLHYLLVTANMEAPYVKNPYTELFATRLQEMGIQNAYCLDGGQTAAIVTGDRLINSVDFGFQRQVSDIIYFATAIPEGA